MIASGLKFIDLGCGLAGISIWLVQHYRELAAVDNSAPHLKIAFEAAQKFGRTNVKFVHLQSAGTLSDIGEFDFLSGIVLQHNPPPIIVEMLRWTFSSIKPGCIVYFQVPTSRLGYRFVADDYLVVDSRLEHPEIRVISQ